VKLTRLAALAVLGVLAGCASAPPKTIYLTFQEWQDALRARGVDPATVPFPLSVTEDMRLEARRIAGPGSPPEQLSRLQQSLFNAAWFPFQYENRSTLTSAEAYYRRQGNCLSFTNMFVALGRSLGAPLTTGMVTRVRGSEREGDLIVVNTHVIAVLTYAGGSTFYDFDVSRDKRPSAVKLLDDLWITALFLNNKGADELRAGRPDVALQQFQNSVRLAPEFAGAWGNLGVTLRRLGNLNEAFAAYERALALEPDNPTVLTNVAAIYRSLGKDQEAERALSAGSLSRASPHVLIIRGDLELARGRADVALQLFSRARRAAPELVEAWVAKARAELALGKRSAARRSLNRAIKLSPQDPAARALLAGMGEGA
jgi:Flp pilus assembly protein TadD